MDRLDQLRQFLEHEIVPLYDNFDAGHRRDHVHQVMDRALNLAQYYPEVDPAIVLAAAAYHDLGLAHGREQHHIHSAHIVRQDDRLLQWFTTDEINIIADAAQDHRASSGTEPRTIYGKIVAEADRLIEPTTIIRRTIQFSLDHFPQFTREQHLERVVQHLHEKYGEGGYLRLWIPHSDNAARLQQLHRIIADNKAISDIFNRLYQQLTSSSD